jgi:hypothetical protein
MTVLTRDQYIELVNQNIDDAKTAIEGRNSELELTANTFFKADGPTTIDSSLFLECDDDWGLPFPFGWIALEEHFTGTNEQDYYTDNIIEVKFD